MTSDEEKDPPVPEYLEGITLKRVHDGQVAENRDVDGATSQQADASNS